MAGIDLDPTVPRGWTAIVAYWRHVRQQPCARCGRIIDYDTPRYAWIWRDQRGRKQRSFKPIRGAVRKENPWALDVGHILEQDRDPRTRWAPCDTQPEHAYCNRQAGARYVNSKRGKSESNRARAAYLRTSRQW
jgi:hypothetical protein